MEETIQPMHSQICKRANFMANVQFSLLICCTLKAFVKAMKICLFEVTITRLKILQSFAFQIFIRV